MAPTTLLAGIRSATAALTLGVVLLTGTGCSSDNPAETAKITPATNGINTVVGPIKLADMLILSHGAEQPGRIMGTLFNTSSKDAVVTISGASGSKVSIPVKANGETSLAQPPAMMLDPTAGSPGSMVTVRVSEDSTGTSADVATPGPRLHAARIPVIHARRRPVRHPSGALQPRNPGAPPPQPGPGPAPAQPLPSPSP